MYKKSENFSKLFLTPYNSVRNFSNITSNSGTSEPIANLKSTNDQKERDYLPKVSYELEKLLNGLGPRYIDWFGCDPLPLDAYMLPANVPCYQLPFRVTSNAKFPNYI